MSEFKLYIHTKPLPDQCGVMMFLNRLIKEMKSQGYHVTTNFNEENITHMLCVIADMGVIEECRLRKIQVIARFSEINIHYYDRLMLTYNNADKIIYQSIPNQISFNFEFGHRNILEEIIKNGINYNEFPKIEHKNKTIFSLGAFHKRGKGSHVKKNKSLEYILNALIELFKEDSEWKYYVAGPGDHHIELKKYLEMPCFKNRLFFIKKEDSNDFMSKEEIFKIAKECSIYIHPVMNDSCPNSLIECLSMGFPIVYFDYTSLSEMFSGQLEAIPIEFRHSDIVNGIKRAYDNFEMYNKSSLHLANTKYNIENVVKQYVDFLIK